MTVTFKPYRRRDGSLMLYVNRSNGVSVGLSPENGWAPYGKNSTLGMRNAMGAALGVFREHATPFTGHIEAHQEEIAECGPYVLAITDVANIGGMQVGSDGAYVLRDNMILRCGEPYQES